MADFSPEMTTREHWYNPMCRQPRFVPNRAAFPGQIQLHLAETLEAQGPLRWNNYSEKFHLLLELEEQQMNRALIKYNIPNRNMKYAVMFRDRVNSDLLVLEVPGVSNNCSSLLNGAEVCVFPTGYTMSVYGYRDFHGCVHSVKLDSIELQFRSDLLDYFEDGMMFKVCFTVNRLTLALQHRAVILAVKHTLGKVLFPAPPPYSSQQPELPNLSVFDAQLKENPEQYRAVQHIVAGSSKPAPYLVFGPPGTGKTVTLVEAIKQIDLTQASCHILACASCNSAADLLCMKIVDHVDKGKVLRMYAKSWDSDCIPEKLKACSNLKEGKYFFHAKEELKKYRIIVTTLFTAGRLVTSRIRQGHFTHVFVDEAGHAVETECLIPLAGLLDSKTGQVVLAGDPKQLGPIIKNFSAQKFGLGVSFLERLMNNFSLYQRDKRNRKFNNRFVTKLLRNYRSHPAILEIPKELFYDNELQCHADENSRNSYCRWEHLPRKEFPVIFHEVTGQDERDASSSSFFNTTEVTVLMDYVKKLLQTQGKTISPKDIGIISPYRQQVQEIRRALEKVGKAHKVKDINTLKVGVVEEFQGQERDVILVSIVRSSHVNAKTDRKFNMGLINNNKGFNVTVNRAKALLIVVGNPNTIKTDRTWKRFIDYCRHNGGYIGDARSSSNQQ